MKTAQTVKSPNIDIKDRSLKMARTVFPKENFPFKSPRHSQKSKELSAQSLHISVSVLEK